MASDANELVDRLARRDGARPHALQAEDCYLSLRRLAAYSGLSVRTLRDHLVRPSRPLPHYRLGGKILVKRSEFDDWMREFRATAADAVNELVTTVLRGL